VQECGKGQTGRHTDGRDHLLLSEWSTNFITRLTATSLWNNRDISINTVTRHRASTSNRSHFAFRLLSHIAKLPNSAHLEGTPGHSPKLHPGPCSSAGMRRGTDRQTDRQTDTQMAVTTIYFASTTHTKCNDKHLTDWHHQLILDSQPSETAAMPKCYFQGLLLTIQELFKCFQESWIFKTEFKHLQEFLRQAINPE